MNMECFELFQKIGKIKSISKVANSSHISQSALSQQVQKLEESLGYKLFDRSNRGVELTEWGKIVMKYSDNILRTYNKMMDELIICGNNQKVIKIEADTTIATYCLPCALYKMKEKFSNHEYELISSSSEKIEEDIFNDICEIGFITTEPCSEEIFSYNAVNEKVVLVARSNYDILDEINLKTLLKYPFILLQGECIIKKNLESYLHGFGYDLNDLNISLELESTEAVKNLVLRACGIAFLPYSSIKKEISAKELKIIKLPEISLDYTIYLIYKQSAELSPSAIEFIEGFKKLGNKICC